MCRFTAAKQEKYRVYFWTRRAALEKSGYILVNPDHTLPPKFTDTELSDLMKALHILKQDALESGFS